MGTVRKDRICGPFAFDAVVRLDRIAAMRHYLTASAADAVMRFCRMRSLAPHDAVMRSEVPHYRKMRRYFPALTQRGKLDLGW